MKDYWIHVHVAVVAASIGGVLTLLMVFIWRWCTDKKKDHKNFVEPKSLRRMEIFQSRISRLHQFEQSSSKDNIKDNFYVLQGKKHLFNWSDHPYLAADAVENGWSRFAFMDYKSCMSSSTTSKRSTLLGVYAGDDNGKGNEVGISWEMCQGSNDLMQKIRLNSGLKRVQYPKNSSMSIASVIRTSLPLPGPPFGNYVFPQEAYFEITILYCNVGYHELVEKRREGEKTKLLIENGSSGEGNLDNADEMKVGGKDNGKSGSVMFSLGLTAGGAFPMRVPGSYPGSIGFNSNGSIFFDGKKVVSESENAEWVETDRVIGCGFDPKQKKVFFTLDSELVHVFHCQLEEFGTPLRPTLAANIDILVLVNFGQSAFKYVPANAQRTPNPCFIAPLVNSPPTIFAYDEDNNDSQRLSGSTTTFDYDEGSDELFEIVLDVSANFPHIPQSVR
ncbi:hypothetical protein Lal_00045624 [Lupinus albus]|uniref:Putative SPRY domain, concanavalin A-like lectin/glucanase domain-containing protein n=1 Tax=Lupinus albus TaxID=3870 RepID=A0A6A5NS85_LUPAL|nr:putative SPRY domain, concanavalin A-like lectin/glucanase domain-containing protein [Lupinus albus]KAF1886392.1 hypothetical protein Lal_00045624 [Lupinus albus]